MLQPCNNCQLVSYLRSSGNKRNMNVTFCLAQGLIQSLAFMTKMKYKRNLKTFKSYEWIAATFFV